MRNPTSAALRVEADATADLVLRALCDRRRRQILHLVRDGEMAAGQIAAEFDITQQGVSLHLRVLRQAGLLDERSDGARRLYSLRPGALEPVRAVLEALWPHALDELKRVVEHDHPLPRRRGRG